MIRRLAVPVLVFSIAAVNNSPASAGSGSGALCSIAGSVAPSPGVTYMPQSGTYKLNGTMDCTSSAPTHGTVTGTGTGTMGCLGGSSDAVLTVAWDNGKTSTMHVQIGDFTYGTGGFGTVDEDEFSGNEVGLGWGREAAGAEVRCGTTGVSSYEFAGGVMIGSASGS